MHVSFSFPYVDFHVALQIFPTCRGISIKGDFILFNHFLCTPFSFSFFEQEQLDGAGIDLSSLYKWIEKQAPNGCCTEAWKNRTHWAGAEVPVDALQSVTKAEEYLQIHRPVRRLILSPFNELMQSCIKFGSEFGIFIVGQTAWQNLGGGCQWFSGKKSCED